MRKQISEKEPLLYDEESKRLLKAENADFPNVAIDEYADVVNDVQGAGEDVEPRAKAIARGSIYSAVAVAEVVEKEGVEAAEKMTRGMRAVMVQAFVFLWAVFVGGIHPMIQEWAFWDPVTQEKRRDFLPQTLTACYYLLSVTAGNVITAGLFGKKSVIDCWRPKLLLCVVPAAAILALVETLDSIVLIYIDASMKLVINQIRLPLTALISMFVFARFQTGLQWILIFGITFSVMGYSATSIKGGEVATGVGVSYAFFQACCAAIGTIASELTYKRMPYPFCVQMSQTRTVALILTTLSLVYNFRGGNLFVGWNSRICILLVWLTLRDWSQTFVLKRLSSLWKAMASGLSPCITYVIQVVAYGRKFDIILISFILCLIADIISYALSKRTPKKA